MTESILEIHIERAHKNKSADATKSGESWACNYCTEIFPTCSLVQAHTLKAHKKKYHCKDPLLLEYECASAEISSGKISIRGITKKMFTKKIENSF